MATDNPGQPRGPIEPLVDVVHEGVELGYEALELVTEGLRESLSLQTGGRPGARRQRSGRRPRTRSQPQEPDQRPHLQAGSRASGHATQSRGTIGDLAAIFAELATRAGAAAQEAAHNVSRQGVGRQSVPELAVEAPAGEAATLEFVIWNTSPTALPTVKLMATDLVGSGVRVPQKSVGFKPASLDRIAPGKARAVEVVVKVPANLPPGTYRGLVHADPGDTSAVLELNVTSARSAPRAATKRK